MEAKNAKRLPIFTIPHEMYMLNKEKIDDNLLYYDYNVSHLLKQQEAGVPADDPAYLSAYRSFEGAVFENYIYEMLLYFVKENEQIEHFVLKGPHATAQSFLPNTLAINKKRQIVYRTKHNEIGEVDALIFTNDTLYFVEITLIQSVVKLRRRLPKKRALLELLFPDYDVKPLLILNEGVAGVAQLPDDVTVWLTQPYSASDVLSWFKKPTKRKPFKAVSDKRFSTMQSMPMAYFRYYNSLSWVFKRLRSDKNHVINGNFLRSFKFRQLHDLYTKIYIGYLELSDFMARFDHEQFAQAQPKVLVGIEKLHNGILIPVFCVSYGKKKIDYVYTLENEMKVDRKDPYGITVNEVNHFLKTMQDDAKLSLKQLDTIEKIIGFYPGVSA